MDAQYYWDLLAPDFAEQRCVLAMGPLSAHARWVKSLIRLGAHPPFILADGPGTGALPNPLECSWHILPTGGDSIVHAQRHFDDTLSALPDEARAQLDAYDPNHTARIFCGIASEVSAVGGRPRFGAQPAAWRALDDKAIIDDFWDSCGIERAPSLTASAHAPDLWKQSRRFDHGDGVVFAGDSRDGTNGGADYVRRIVDRDQCDAALAFFRQHCDRIRIMPFLEGIPCSIHGMVFPHDIIAFRPCEMLVLRRPDSGTFQYFGAATLWDPHPADREAMRASARSVGRKLRDAFDYRGVFTIDGVMTADGFRPTELNPRFGAALMRIEQSFASPPLELLDLCVREGWHLDYQPQQLEEFVVSHADANRSAMAWGVMPGSIPDDTCVYRCRLTANQWSAVEDASADANARITTGPASMGTFVRIETAPHELRMGTSFAPTVVAALEHVHTRTGLAAGPWESARNVR